MESVYNAELTFTPKLNEASLKLAEKATNKWKERITNSRIARERALVAEANAAFTFHPTMNRRSKKIVSRIRKYDDPKKSDVQLSFERHDDSSNSLDSSDSGSIHMSTSSREPSFETASVHVTQEAENFIQEVLSSCKGDISSEGDETDDDKARGRKTKFKKVPVSEDPLYKPPPRKTLYLPQSLPYNNADYLFKIKSAKETALNAIRMKRIFTILGPYPYLRKALLKRGWVEKFSDHSCQPILGSPQAIRPRPAKKKKKAAVQKVSSSSSESDIESSEDENDYRNDPEFVRIVSRLLKDISPTFIWTIKRDDIDFKYLNREQIVNHYCKASSFTTKIGLCQHLRSLPWFDASDPNEFFPRCYQLYNPEDREDFIENFEICASLSILKMYSIQHDEHKNKTEADKVEETTDKDDVEMEKAGNHVPLSAITLAVNHLKGVLRQYHNDFIDMPVTPGDDLTHFKRKQILGFSYSLTAKNYTFSSFSEATHSLAASLLQEFDQLNMIQSGIDGTTNTWIMKPGAKSRGRGVIPQNNMDDITRLADSSKEEKWVVQKYIEKPLLVHGIKFDIRQWFMVTDWNPLTLYFYQDCYLRFGSRAFTLDDFDPCIHLCNNSIQKKFLSAQTKNETAFAQGNMWTSGAFKKYLNQQGDLEKWEEVIYPGMKKSIQRVMMTIQDIIEDRKNSFELYGADFMLDENYNPWLIEINCSPAMGGTTKVTERLCSEVLEDVCKVIIDKRENKAAPTGKWELIFKQQTVTVPPYIGVQLAIEGKYIAKPSPARTRLHVDSDPDKASKKAKSPRHQGKQELTPRKIAMKQELRSSKIVGVTVAEETQCNLNSITLVCKHTERYRKEIFTSLTVKDSSSEPTKPVPIATTMPGKTTDTALPSIELRASPHLSTLSISPISCPPPEDKSRVPIKKLLKYPRGRVSELIPNNINPYRLQQIISRQSKPKPLDMLALQNRYSHTTVGNVHTTVGNVHTMVGNVHTTVGNVNSIKVLDVKPKRRGRIKKAAKVKNLTKLTGCPHCESNGQTGVILNLLKSGSTPLRAGKSKSDHHLQHHHTNSTQRPKKHFRVSLNQISTMSQSVVDVRQNGSTLKIVGEQTSN